MNRFFLFALLLLLVAVPLSAQQTQTAPAEGKGAWTKTISLKNEEMLAIYVDPGHIMIVPSDKKEMTIQIQGLPKEELGRVQLTTGEKNLKLDFRGSKTLAGTFAVQLPASMNLDLFASGNVEVRGAMNGKIRIRTSTEGTVNVGDVNGSITIDSTEADVYVGNIHGSANISTNGDLEVEDVTGDLDAKNIHGDTFIKSVAGNLNARTDDGDVSVGDVGGNATVLAGIGDVDLRKVGGVATLNTDGGDIDLFEVPGMVVASSNSGEITLRKVTGAADAKTEDGDITAEMYSGSGGSSKFYTRDGDISMYFPDAAKATVSAKFHVESAGNQQDMQDAADDVITSDWPNTGSEKQGGDLINRYEINGGGDSVLIETVNGELLVKKLQPQPEPKPATQKQN